MKKIEVNEDLIKIIISATLFALSFFIKEYTYPYLIVLLISYIIVAYEMIIESFKNILKGTFFDENILMIIATLGAFCIHEYPEAIMVILLFQVGEYLSDLAVNHSKQEVVKLMDLRSDKIRILKDGKEQIIETKNAQVGDIFVVYPGEKIPLDGIIKEGEAYIDTASLTGESIPKKVGEKDSVLSGTICKDKVLTIQATKEFEMSTANKIIKLLEENSEKKSHSEKFITKFSKIYTPIIVTLAILLVIFQTAAGNSIHNSFYTASVFLVMSCPCALVLSVPLAFFCGIGRASKEGILIKGANELENLTNIKTVLFDKTGTLTKGVFGITEIKNYDIEKNKLLEIAAYGEYYSNHPIAHSILKEYNRKIDTKRIKSFQEFPGKGIQVEIDKTVYRIGNEQLLKDNNMTVEQVETIGTVTYIATEKKLLGYLVISDCIKEEAYSISKELRKVGVKNLAIVSGDMTQIVERVAQKLEISTYYAQLLPEQKVQIVKEQEEPTAFVGDGINDAPVLQLADIGISMGGIGSDAAIEASDIVLMSDDISKITSAFKISKLTKKLVIGNISFALLVKAMVLIFGILGMSTIWLAVFADVGVTLLCILNTLQILKRKLS